MIVGAHLSGSMALTYKIYRSLRLTKVPAWTTYCIVKRILVALNIALLCAVKLLYYSEHYDQTHTTSPDQTTHVIWLLMYFNNPDAPQMSNILHPVIASP